MATERTRMRREAILELLRAHPEGMTMSDIARAVGVRRLTAIEDVRWLRRDPDTVNIPATPQGYRQPWVYTLTNDREENAWWAHNRIGDQESRFRTELGMAATLVRVTDGRSLDGRKARKIHRVLGYLMQELAELEAETNGVPV